MNASFKIEDGLTIEVWIDPKDEEGGPYPVLTLREDDGSCLNAFLLKSTARAIASALMGAAAEIKG